jgi:carboxylesterase
MSMAPISEALCGAGFVVDAPCLPGHGTSPRDLEWTSYADWVDAAETAYVSLAARCPTVGVVGLSMGGALAVQLAVAHGEIAGIALINPLLEPVDPSFITLLTEALVAGSTVIPSIGSDIALGDHPPTGGYDVTPVRALHSLVCGIEELAPRLGSITVPVLLFSSRIDHVVPTSTGAYLESSLTCPFERVMLERSFHVATLDYDRDVIVRRTVEFMERLAL